MTVEARIGFILFFFLVWCVAGLIPWAVAAVIVRGRGALLALPIALAAACAGGVLLPLMGQRDVLGFVFSLPVAFAAAALGSAAGILLARRLRLAGAAPTAVPQPDSARDSSPSIR